MTSNVIDFSSYQAERLTVCANEIDRMIDALSAAIRMEDLSLAQACLLLIKAKQQPR